VAIGTPVTPPPTRWLAENAGKFNPRRNYTPIDETSIESCSVVIIIGSTGQ
jgi:hypothetical protein